MNVGNQTLGIKPTIPQQHLGTRDENFRFTPLWQQNNKNTVALLYLPFAFIMHLLYTVKYIKAIHSNCIHSHSSVCNMHDLI